MTLPAVDLPPVAPAGVAPSDAGRGSSLWRRVLRNPNSLAGILLLGFLAIVCFGAPLFTPHDPTQQDLANALAPPSLDHPLGTDALGQDELSRLLYGGRYSMLLGIIAVAFALVIGVPLGLIGGYFGGGPDLAIQAVTDVLLSFPGILLALALVAGLGLGLQNVAIALAISSIPAFIRLARSSALSLQQTPFIEVARSMGVAPWRIVVRHVLPNSVAPVVVQASVQVGLAVLIAAGLGFLGLGVQPPTPEWGSMLGGARTYIFRAPMLSILPGIAVFLVVVGFNLLGDGLRDALDPRLRR